LNNTRFQEVIDVFKILENLEPVIEAIDESYIPIMLPVDFSTAYINYKEFYSIVLLKIVNYKKRFTYIYIGEPGNVYDSRVFQKSQF
ncbi:31141_t:CDS:1, partial [Racocetra persica]